MRVIRSIVLATVGAGLAGCYSLRPVSTASAELGSLVAFDMNDAGRAALGQSVAPEIRQLEGRLVEKPEGDYLLAVTAVRTFRGGEQVWKGERVRIKPEFVGLTYERKFSTGRTIAASALALGAFFALAAGGFVPGLGGDNPTPDPKPTPTELSPRFVIPQR